MTNGFIAYAASAAFVGALYGGVHTYNIVSERDRNMHMMKRLAFVTSGSVLGAILNPIALPFYPFLTTFYSLHECPFRKAHKYV